MDTYKKLLEVFNNAKGVKVGSARSRLLRFCKKASKRTLEKIIDGAKDEFVVNAVKAELWWRDVDKNPENLLKIIKRVNDPEKAGLVITKFGNMRYRSAVPAIIKCLDNLNMRDDAALAIRKFRSQEAVGPIIRSIKKYPDGAECLLYALEALDCSEVAEVLIDLFISKPKASGVRCDVFMCFTHKSVKRIPKAVKDTCCVKILRAIAKTKNKDNAQELKELYELVLQVEESHVR